MSLVPAVVDAPEYPEVRSPMDMPVEAFKSGLQRRGENRKALMDWIKTSMVDGTDFGKIHTVGKTKCEYAAKLKPNECPNQYHWSKPVLFQPGAQKICGMLGVFVSYPAMTKYEDAVLSGVDIKHVILRCEIRDSSGTLVGDGMGARSLEQDYNDLNKSLKMAAKSAQISATLRMAGLSEVFTQDLEDMQDGQAEKLAQEEKAKIDRYASRFMDTLDADIEKGEKEYQMLKVHDEVNSHGIEFYQSVWRTLSSKDRSAIKVLISDAKRVTCS